MRGEQTNELLAYCPGRPKNPGVDSLSGHHRRAKKNPPTSSVGGLA
jgi:hypothetical protein